MPAAYNSVSAALQQPWDSSHFEGICLRLDGDKPAQYREGGTLCPYCNEPAICHHVEYEGETLTYCLHYALNSSCRFITPYFKCFPDSPVGPSALLEQYSGTFGDLRAAVMGQGDYQYKEYAEFTAVYDHWCRLFLFTKLGHPFYPSVAGFLFICDERLWGVDERQFAEMAREHWVRLDEDSHERAGDMAAVA